MGNTLVITCPGVNLEGQVMPGAVRADQPDVNTGKPVTNAMYSDNPGAFEGAIIYLCANGPGWTCGSGKLRNILRYGEQPFAWGVINNDKVIIRLPMPLTEAQDVNKLPRH